MPKKNYNELTAARVKHVTDPGIYSDGGGLFLRVAKDTSRSWFVRFRLNGVSNPPQHQHRTLSGDGSC